PAGAPAILATEGDAARVGAAGGGAPRPPAGGGGRRGVVGGSSGPDEPTGEGLRSLSIEESLAEEPRDRRGTSTQSQTLRLSRRLAPAASTAPRVGCPPDRGHPEKGVAWTSQMSSSGH